MRLEQLVKNIQSALVYTDFNFLPLKLLKNASWFHRVGATGRRKKINKGGDKLTQILPIEFNPPTY